MNLIKLFTIIVDVYKICHSFYNTPKNHFWPPEMCKVDVLRRQEYDVGVAC